jgi:hypothetical protein
LCVCVCAQIPNRLPRNTRVGRRVVALSEASSLRQRSQTDRQQRPPVQVHTLACLSAGGACAAAAAAAACTSGDKMEQILYLQLYRKAMATRFRRNRLALARSPSPHPRPLRGSLLLPRPASCWMRYKLQRVHITIADCRGIAGRPRRHTKTRGHVR